MNKELDRIHKMAFSDTADNFLKLSDEDKRLVFAAGIRESTRRKEAEEKVAALSERVEELELGIGIALSETHEGDYGQFHITKVGLDFLQGEATVPRQDKERVKELEAHVERLRRLADYWIMRGMPRGMMLSEQEFKTWHAIGYGSETWRETPAQSLNHIRAEVEEETIQRCFDYVNHSDDMIHSAVSIKGMPRKYAKQAGSTVEEGE